MNLFETIGIFFLCTFTFAGCASTYQDEVFPPAFLTKVDTSITFSQLKESPSSHLHTSILVGGEVLSAKRFKDHTRITILQLPLTPGQEPTTDRTRSQGRFMAIQQEFLDPATVPTGTRVTLVAEVSGETKESLDEMDYVYPTLTIRHLKVWQKSMAPPYWMSPYGGGGFAGYPYFGYGGPFRGFYNPYLGGFGGFNGPYPYYWY